MSSRQPWERAPDETEKAFAAFAAYRDQEPAKRTLVAAARAVYGERGVLPSGAPVGRIRAWCDNHEWRVRTAAYDAHNDALKLKAAERAAIDMGERHAKEAEALQMAALEPAMALLRKMQGGAQPFDAMEPAELIRLLRSGGYVWAHVARFERLSRGVADGRVEVTGPGGGPIEMTVEAATEVLGPILGVEPSEVVDVLAEQRKKQRAADRADGVHHEDEEIA